MTDSGRPHSEIFVPSARPSTLTCQLPSLIFFAFNASSHSTFISLYHLHGTTAQLNSTHLTDIKTLAHPDQYFRSEKRARRLHGTRTGCDTISSPPDNYVCRAIFYSKSFRCLGRPKTNGMCGKRRAHFLSGNILDSSLSLSGILFLALFQSPKSVRLSSHLHFSESWSDGLNHSEPRKVSNLLSHPSTTSDRVNYPGRTFRLQCASWSNTVHM